MSQRFLIPTNLFYHWQDPTPNPALIDDPFEGFPTPNTGDIYFNVSSRMLRVFYEGNWHDAGGSGGAGGGNEGEVVVQATEPSTSGLDLWVDTDDTGTYPTNFIVSTASPSGIPEGGINTVWLQY
jgi:hypothetical protein